MIFKKGKQFAITSGSLFVMVLAFSSCRSHGGTCPAYGNKQNTNSKGVYATVQQMKTVAESHNG